MSAVVIGKLIVIPSLEWRRDGMILLVEGLKTREGNVRKIIILIILYYYSKNDLRN